MTRVLITGGNGFIGKYCTELLKIKGFEVHTLSTLHQKKINGIEIHKVNLHDKSQTRTILRTIKPTHLLHLAWYTEHGLFWNSDENLKWKNATYNLINEFAINGGKRIVCSGTCAEYSWNKEICFENDLIQQPSTLYGKTKYETQILVNEFTKKYGISSAWGRVFMLYGPGEDDRRLIPSVIKTLLKNEFMHCTDGEQVRDYLHVIDVAQIFVSLIESNLNGIINIASGEPIKIKNIIELIANKLNKSNLVRLGAIKSNKNESLKIVADINRLKQELLFKPSVSLNQGIDLYIDEIIKEINIQ